MTAATSFLSAFSPSIPPAALPDTEGQVVAGYTLGPVIGHGGFSTIRRASSASGDIVAAKIVRRSDLSRQSDPSLAHKRLQHEAETWSSLRHEHILPLFCTVNTPYADFFFTLYCPDGTLFDILARHGHPALAQDEAGMMFRQVVKGLRYLHEEALLVHRDIKLENVLVDDMGVCRIGDFGMSRRIGELDADDEDLRESLQPQDAAGVHRTASFSVRSSRQTKHGLPMYVHQNGARHRNSAPVPSSNGPSTHGAHVFQPGSLPYAAPELLHPQTSGPLLPDPAQDMWALGVLLYVLLTGRLPFADAFEPRLQMKILRGESGAFFHNPPTLICCLT
jgi:serine/threonine protein kinase